MAGDDVVPSLYMTIDRTHGLEVRSRGEEIFPGTTLLVSKDSSSGFSFVKRGSDVDNDTTVARITPEGDVYIAGAVYTSSDNSELIAPAEHKNYPWEERESDGRTVVTLASGAASVIEAPQASLSVGSIRGALPFSDITSVPEASLDTPGLVRLTTALDTPQSTMISPTAGALATVYQTALSRMKTTGDVMTGTLRLTNGASLITEGNQGRVGVNVAFPQHSVDVKGDVNFTGNLLKNGTILTFPESPWESSGDRVFIAEGRKLGIGTNSPSRSLHVAGDVELSGDLYRNGTLFPKPWTDGSSGVTYTGAKNVGIGVDNPSYKLHVSGGIYASGRVLQLSDMRHKSHIRPIDDALEKVCTLSGFTYDDEGGPESGEERRVGVSAQQVQRVLPEVVSTDPQTGTLSVEYGNMVALLVEAVKELREEVRVLHLKPIMANSD